MEAVIILPETGRGTMRSMVEGHVQVLRAFAWPAADRRRADRRRLENSRVPLHHPQRGWSPSPDGEDS